MKGPEAARAVAQECADFAAKRRTALAAEINPEVVVVNCGVGGRAIEDWIDPAFDAVLWDACIGARLPASGLALRHARVVYHKAANAQTTLQGGGVRPPYPDPQSDFSRFRQNLEAFAVRVRQKLPSVQAVYTTSRSYIRSDYQADGVHPAPGALDKISGMIHARLMRHAWYRR